MADTPTLRTWYLATNRNGLLRAFDQIQVAVVSARQHTSLSPVCLVDHGDDVAGVARQLDWLRARGVRLIFHRSSLLADLRGHYGSLMDAFSGHWLRCDIPMIETDEQFVLYTDIDVMFSGPVGDNSVWPRYIACGPEHHRDDASYFNSGVMVMNLPNLRARLPDLADTIRRRFDTARAHDDQGALNELFRDEWDWLAPAWNWKPYWGRYNGARIVHFHGPKPALARHMLLGRQPAVVGEMAEIFNRNPAGYAYYTERFFAHLRAAEAMPC